MTTLLFYSSAFLWPALPLAVKLVCFSATAEKEYSRPRLFNVPRGVAATTIIWKTYETNWNNGNISFTNKKCSQYRIHGWYGLYNIIYSYLTMITMELWLFGMTAAQPQSPGFQQWLEPWDPSPRRKRMAAGGCNLESARLGFRTQCICICICMMCSYIYI